MFLNRITFTFKLHTLHPYYLWCILFVTSLLIKTFGKIKTFFDLPTLFFGFVNCKHKYFYDRPHHDYHSVKHTITIHLGILLVTWTLPLTSSSLSLFRVETAVWPGLASWDCKTSQPSTNEFYLQEQRWLAVARDLLTASQSSGHRAVASTTIQITDRSDNSRLVLEQTVLYLRTFISLFYLFRPARTGRLATTNTGL